MTITNDEQDAIDRLARIADDVFTVLRQHQDQDPMSPRTLKYMSARALAVVLGAFVRDLVTNDQDRDRAYTFCAALVQELDAIVHPPPPGAVH